jgi:predicted nucleic acid-binding protein
MILVDSNVIIDVLGQDPTWRAWSEATLSDAADHDDIASSRYTTYFPKVRLISRQ